MSTTQFFLNVQTTFLDIGSKVCIFLGSQAGSEGELCPQLDSLGSSGSTSTLASSVIEVDSGRDNLSLVQDDYEDMAPLPSPPTMSITEEIMQFINQNCVREGMAELSADVVRIVQIK